VRASEPFVDRPPQYKTRAIIRAPVVPYGCFSVRSHTHTHTHTHTHKRVKMYMHTHKNTHAHTHARTHTHTHTHTHTCKHAYIQTFYDHIIWHAHVPSAAPYAGMHVMSVRYIELSNTSVHIHRLALTQRTCTPRGSTPGMHVMSDSIAMSNTDVHFYRHALTHTTHLYPQRVHPRYACDVR